MYQQMMNERHLMMAHIKNTLDSKSIDVISRHLLHYGRNGCEI